MKISRVKLADGAYKYCVKSKEVNGSFVIEKENNCWTACKLFANEVRYFIKSENRTFKTLKEQKQKR